MLVSPKAPTTLSMSTSTPFLSRSRPSMQSTGFPESPLLVELDQRLLTVQCRFRVLYALPHLLDAISQRLCCT